MMILLGIGIILGIVVLPFAANLNPTREHTKTIRIMLSVIGLVSSIFMLSLVILGFYLTRKDKNGLTPLAKDSDREI